MAHTEVNSRRNSKERITQTIDVYGMDEMPELVMSQSPRRQREGATTVKQGGKDKLLKDLFVKMSYNDARESKNVFRLLRTSLNATV